MYDLICYFDGEYSNHILTFAITFHQNGARKNICTRVHIFRTLELEDKAITCRLHHTFIIILKCTFSAFSGSKKLCDSPI